MISSNGRYILPDKLESDLDRVRAYWEGLKRGENDVPFSDDMKFSSHARLAREVIVIEVFEQPLRFRFEIVGDDILDRYGGAIAGKFTDEVDLHAPANELTQQCRATVERRAPTYFRQEPETLAGAPSSPGAKGYSRLVLPLWGNGRVEMLIAAVHFN
jgi:hypothetical protein